MKSRFFTRQELLMLFATKETHFERQKRMNISIASYFRYLHAYRTGLIYHDYYTCPECYCLHLGDYPLCDRCKKSIAIAYNKITEQARRIKRKNIQHSFSPLEWRNKIESTHGICPSCKQEVGLDKLTLDHIFPIARAEEGRIYTINDVQPLCLSCNQKKSARIPLCNE